MKLLWNQSMIYMDQKKSRWNFSGVVPSPESAFCAPGVKLGVKLGVKTANSHKTGYSTLKFCKDTLFHTRNWMVAVIFTSCEILTLFGAL